MATSMLELLSQDSLFKIAEEKIEGGKADGHPDSDYPEDQLEKGIKVEKEHTDSEAEAKEIVKDHLEEEKELDPDKDKGDLEYYDELGDMEEGLKKKANGDMLAHYQEVRKKGPAFRKGFEKAAACNHDRRFSGRRPRKSPLNKPDVSEEGASPIRGGRGPGQGPSVKEAKELTSRGRKQVSESNFVFPKERRYPIHDASHARNALARVSQHGTPSEQEAVRKAVHAKYPGIGD